MRSRMEEMISRRHRWIMSGRCLVCFWYGIVGFGLTVRLKTLNESLEVIFFGGVVGLVVVGDLDIWDVVEVLASYAGVVVQHGNFLDCILLWHDEMSAGFW